MATQTLNNVHGILLYTNIQKPKLQYESTTEYEWSVQVAISKEQAKEWKKAYKKQPVKEFDREDFIKKFGLSELPAGYEDTDEFYVVTLKRGTKMKDKTTGEMKPVPEGQGPKVFLRSGSVQKDITNTTLVGNGSIGAVSIFHKENAKYGDAAGLKNVLVMSLVEYKEGAGEAGSEFGEFMGEDDGADEFSAPTEKPAKAATKPVKAKEVVESESTGEDDLPF